MPRGRRRFSNRPNAFKAQANAAKQAAKIKIQIPPAPKLKVLKGALEGVVAASIEVRIAAMGQVLNWYDLAMDHMMKKAQVDPVLAKHVRENIGILSKANKMRERGVDGAGGVHEQETSFKMAIRQFEKYCAPLSPLSIDEYFKKYEDAKTHLERKASKVAGKYAPLEFALTNAFPDAGLKFKVTADVSGRRYDGAGTMLYGKDVARDMLKVMKREGLLKVFSTELLPITKVMAIEMVPDGQGGVQPVLDPKKHLAMIEKTMAGFVTYCQSDAAPHRIIRKGQPLPNPLAAGGNAPQRQPRAPRQPGQGGKGLVGGRYRSGSAIATIYERMADGKTHSKSELFAGLGNCESGKFAPFVRLLRHVGVFNEFKIEVNGDQVTMTKGGN